MKRIAVIVFLAFAVIAVWGMPGLAVAEEEAKPEEAATEEAAKPEEEAAPKEEAKPEETAKTEEVPTEEAATEEVPTVVSRLVICVGIDAREPVGETDTISASTETAYCFLEAKNVSRDTQVKFVWYLGQNVMAQVYLPIRKSYRWRTYSSKNLAGLKGDWRVELQDENGAALKEVSFKVE
jgi:hypothetical protein